MTSASRPARADESAVDTSLSRSKSTIRRTAWLDTLTSRSGPRLAADEPTFGTPSSRSRLVSSHGPELRPRRGRFAVERPVSGRVRAVRAHRSPLTGVPFSRFRCRVTRAAGTSSAWLARRAWPSAGAGSWPTGAVGATVRPWESAVSSADRSQPRDGRDADRQRRPHQRAWGEMRTTLVSSPTLQVSDLRAPPGGQLSLPAEG
jgi:hypothetical protein